MSQYDFVRDGPVGNKTYIVKINNKSYTCKLYFPILTFTSVGTTSTVYLYNYQNTPNCEYSTDGETWNAMPTSSPGVSISAGQSIMVRGMNSDGFSKIHNVYSNFVMTGAISASGSVMSLIDGVGETTTIPANYCFYRLFYGCTALITPPELPATILAGSCYSYMFYNCTALTTPPELPAIALWGYCYYYMFYGCTSLTTPPALPATTLADDCYSRMFRGCTSLTTPPVLPATTLADDCYSEMFDGCTSLTTPPILPATTLTNGCYAEMFSGCINITTPPALPATTLMRACYQQMFSGCINITTPPALPATTLADYCYRSMFYYCTSLKVSNSSASGYTQFFTCPSSIPTDAVLYMFSNTGGSYTSDPVANGTYYYY